MSSSWVYRAIAPLAVALLFTGCSSQGPRQDESAPVEEKPDYSEVGPAATPAQPGSPQTQSGVAVAYQPLLDKARQATASGDYEGALALLERAHRIDPDSAEIYLDLARTHLASGDTAQASAVAERGLLYCSGRSQCDALRALTR